MFCGCSYLRTSQSGRKRHFCVVYCMDPFPRNTVRCRYNAVNFLHIPHNRHQTCHSSYEVPCVSKVFSSSPRHDALDASSRCVLKYTARCGIPYVSKVVIRRFVTRLRALRGRRFETNGDTSNQSNGHQFQNFYNAITA